LIFPKFSNIDVIHSIRERYDPLAKYIAPHITLVFPFKSNIGGQEIKEHIKKQMKGIEPFHIELQGISKESGNYLFLNLSKGKEQIIELQRRLYKGILEDYYPDFLKKVEFLPHLTVGRFESDPLCNMAFEELKGMQEIFADRIDEIVVEIIDHNLDSIIESTIKIT
jgi:2'-5' RNA ligase